MGSFLMWQLLCVILCYQLCILLLLLNKQVKMVENIFLTGDEADELLENHSHLRTARITTPNFKIYIICTVYYVLHRHAVL